MISYQHFANATNSIKSTDGELVEPRILMLFMILSRIVKYFNVSQETVLLNDDSRLLTMKCAGRFL